MKQNLDKTKSFPFSQVIVIGGTGQTGHRLLENLVGLSQKITLLGTSRTVEGEIPAGALAGTVLHDVRKWGTRVQWSAVDLEADPETLKQQLDSVSKKLEKNKSTALIFAAAFTNVDGCEIDPSKCERINKVNTISVLDWALREFQAKVVFYSTDYVFDGIKGVYSEDHPRNAVCVYGQSKVDVEEWLEKSAPQSLILRTTGVYDYLPGSKNFLMQMLDLWGQKRTTRIPSDQWSNPVWSFELAKATLDLLSREAVGIFNVAGGKQMARVDFAKLIATVFEFDLNLIQPVITAELQQKAKRPLNGGLNCEKLKSVLGWAPQAPEPVLRSFKEREWK